MSLLEKHRDKAVRFVEVCHKLAAKSFVTSHGGNLAWLVEKNVIMITATCLSKADHTPEDVVFIDNDGKVLEGRNKPTGETPMYLEFFRSRPDINSVIHCHPECCGAYAVTAETNLLMRPIYPEICLEIGPVPVVPYATPLTKKLADNFKPVLPKYNAFLMENHGLVLMTSKDIRWAYLLVEELEGAAASLLQAQAIGKVKEISRENLIEMDEIIAKRNLPRCGAPGINKNLSELYF